MDTDIQNKLADALNNNPLPIEIKGTSETRKYELKQPTFKILIETSKLISEIGINDFQDIFNEKNVFQFIGEHGEKITRLIAIVLEGKTEIEKDTIDFIQLNLNAHEVYDLLSNIILRIGVQDFQKSIIGIIPMSLLNQGELIALMKSHSTPSNS